MTDAVRDWREVRELSGKALQSEVFSILMEASLLLANSEDCDPRALEVVPRLAGLIASHPELDGFREIHSALARRTGLWNYIDKENADTADLLVAETVTAPELDDLVLHREQIGVLNQLFAGKNVVLSAPTSFGKSLLIDALLASGRYERVAIVLPTIALLDEFRRRLQRRFRGRFQLVMHPADQVGAGPVIFLGTQERLLTRDDITDLDLTVVDEFYKLDPNRRDERSVTLNALVYRLLGRSKQFFFLGPNIDNVTVDTGGRWPFKFIRTKFSTVAVDTLDLRGVAEKQERLMDEISEDGNWPALVFISSPDRANKLTLEAANGMAVSEEGAAFAAWLAENVGDNWPLVKAVSNGFGIHHGRIPRSIAAHMVRFFNDKKLPVLFCTSTLIEGVNTAAKTVLIFDKAINQSDYDFFTFANIRGRAGRLGEHHVGQVYLFNAPPEEKATDISPTLFGDEDEAPDDYVVYLDDADTSRRVDERVEALRGSLELDGAGLRVAAAVGLDLALEVKTQVERAMRFHGGLAWSGYPTYREIQYVVNVICNVKESRDYGAFTEAQLARYINELRKPKPMRLFFQDFNKSHKSDDLGFDMIFKFLRACEYGLPQIISLIELYVRARRPEADYGLFLQGLSRWFRQDELKNLEEEGIPIQISERFYVPGDDREGLVRRMSVAASTEVDSLSDFERDWVKSALGL
ncbi:hypothetical protein ELG72_24960 [Rhizobium leguminosarum]|uniref:DEAD/DEAH box helicase n=1 Tax=Rhizobium leguminosarum TaxID=384 RepID=UPI001031FC1C|nr:DEAD/DEAH box helicase [Rhizobium leguminosarum]TBG66111.1 hypothetical protein ELG72_24960 [Rhizobium leguminosarum]TBG70869.1 hypothetical protein ELG74_24710 [Rhizobium leguminosarum]